MRLYSIEVSWRTIGTMYVEANSEAEALSKAQLGDFKEIRETGDEKGDYKLEEYTVREEED
jgi:hypothetical protein